MAHEYFITDVFAEQPYAGNQLATLPDAAGIDGDEMQKIARAFNFAETTFITGGSLDAGFDVRIFTPNSELPFAGHPTLGTSFLLRNHIVKTTARQIVLNLGVGPIAVTFTDDRVLWMRQNPPVFGDTLPVEQVSDALGIQTTEIDQRFPCQRVSTGLEFVIVPLTSYDALKRARVSGDQLAGGCFVFCAGGYNAAQSIQARMFAGALGVSEDPATGSANGCLAAYLCEHDYFNSNRKVDICVGQGYEIARPSQLYLKAQPSHSGIDVDVGGRVNLVATGTWLV